MRITEEWLKENGWEVHRYNILANHPFHYAAKMFGKDRVVFTERRDLKIYRDYSYGDVYCNALIDDVDTVEKLCAALGLCGIKMLKP